MQTEDRLILVVDDDKDIVEGLTESLADKRFRVKGFLTAKELLDFLSATKEAPDLILLDLALPDIEGLDICKRLKSTEKFSSIPIIILSGKTAEPDKISGLNIGADDYVVKPFSVEELTARINAVLRRPGIGEEKRIEIGDILIIDIRNYKVIVDNEKVDLTPVEFRLLEYLSAREGQVLTRERILDYLWGNEKIVEGRTVDVHINHLREKLGKAGKLIKNVRGVGYKIET